MDDRGGIRSSTLPTSFPQERLRTIASHVLQTFNSVRKALMECNELRVDYEALSLQAKRGPKGTMVYLTPLTPTATAELGSACPGLE